jgi:hypothetical protein
MLAAKYRGTRFVQRAVHGGLTMARQVKCKIDLDNHNSKPDWDAFLDAETPRDAVTFQQCGGSWYQPQFAGTSVTYVVVNPPR